MPPLTPGPRALDRPAPGDSVRGRRGRIIDMGCLPILSKCQICPISATAGASKAKAKCMAMWATDIPDATDYTQHYRKPATCRQGCPSSPPQKTGPGHRPAGGLADRLTHEQDIRHSSIFFKNLGNPNVVHKVALNSDNCMRLYAPGRSGASDVSQAMIKNRPLCP